MTLVNLIVALIWWAFRLAGVLAFAMIAYSGFQYLTSGGNTSQQKDAQERIVSAIIGLILLFAFYIILYTINPDILREPGQAPSTNLPAVDSSDSNNSSVEEFLESVSGVADPSCQTIKISKECPEGRELDYGDCIADTVKTEVVDSSLEGENGWACEFKGVKERGTCLPFTGTIKLYCFF